MMTLYDYFRSSASYRVRIALHLKNLPFQTKTIHLVNDGGQQFSADYTSINPQQLVPTLQDGSLYLTQSLAIIEYLDECYKAHPLLPESTLERAKVRAFALSIIADIHPLNNQRVLKYLTTVFQIGQTEKTTWYHHWLQLGLSALEAQLSSTTHTSNCCFGDTPTLADICLIPQLYNAKRFALDLSLYPTLVKIDNYCQTLKAFQLAYPMEK